MITAEQYFGGKSHDVDQAAAAADWLSRVNKLLAECPFDAEIDPGTGTQISGSKGGSGDGGFRLPTSTTGSAKSSHKEARAVDIYDPEDELDLFITDAMLEAHGLYREAGGATIGWCHLTTRAPHSGKRTFAP